MSLLAKSTRGPIEAPLIFTVYGSNGVGKSTLAASAPSPYFVSFEKGSDRLNVTRSPVLESWEELIGLLGELTVKPHDFKTIVFDTLSTGDEIATAYTCKVNGGVKTLGDIPWGRGGEKHLATWEDFWSLIEKLQQKRQVTIVLLAHSSVSDFTDAMNKQAKYKRYSLKLPKDSAEMICNKSDAVLFAHGGVILDEDEKKRKYRILDEEQRYLYTDRRAGYDAKNRFDLPSRIKLKKQNGWADLMAVIHKQKSESSLELVKKIEESIALVREEELSQKIRQTLAEAGSDIPKLKAIAKRLEEILEEQPEDEETSA